MLENWKEVEGYGNNAVHPTFKHGSNFKIGCWCVIEKNVIVGDDVTLENWVLLKEGTKIGNNVFIDHYCKTGTDSSFGNRIQWKPSASIADGTVVGNDVFIGPMVMTLRGKVKGVQLPPIICDGAYIGAGSTIMPGVVVDENAVVGAMSLVIKNVEEGDIVIGIPAKSMVKK